MSHAPEISQYGQFDPIFLVVFFFKSRTRAETRFSFLTDNKDTIK